MRKKRNIRPEAFGADVCLILEGTYPFVTGGVSAWVHEIIRGQPQLTFSLICLHPGTVDLTPKYRIPPNVVGQRNVHVQRLPAGARYFTGAETVCRALEAALTRLTTEPAGLETGRPALLTEHGLYTNERRVELAMADWLHDNTPPFTGAGEACTRHT